MAETYANDSRGGTIMSLWASLIVILLLIGVIVLIPAWGYEPDPVEPLAVLDYFIPWLFTFGLGMLLAVFTLIISILGAIVDHKKLLYTQTRIILIATIVAFVCQGLFLLFSSAKW
jgi:hypothetical protein